MGATTRKMSPERTTREQLIPWATAAGNVGQSVCPLKSPCLGEGNTGINKIGPWVSAGAHGTSWMTNSTWRFCSRKSNGHRQKLSWWGGELGSWPENGSGSDLGCWHPFRILKTCRYQTACSVGGITHDCAWSQSPPPTSVFMQWSCVCCSQACSPLRQWSRYRNQESWRKKRMAEFLERQWNISVLWTTPLEKWKKLILPTKDIVDRVDEQRNKNKSVQGLPQLVTLLTSFVHMDLLDKLLVKRFIHMESLMVYWCFSVSVCRRKEGEGVDISLSCLSSIYFKATPLPSDLVFLMPALVHV